MERRMRTVAIIQARLGSTRLPKKVARRLGEQSLLQWVIGRVQGAKSLAQVIVAAPDTPEDRQLANFIPPDVPLVFGSEQDVLSRYLRALELYPADAVVRICADNPYLDSDMLDRLVQEGEKAPDCDYVSYRLASGRPVILSPLGLFGEWCRADALRQAAESPDPADHEHVTRGLYRQPDRFNLRLLDLPAGLERPDLRLTVDCEDDFRHVEEIYTALAPQPITWQRIVTLLDTRPQLSAQMSALNQRYLKI